MESMDDGCIVATADATNHVARDSNPVDITIRVAPQQLLGEFPGQIRLLGGLDRRA